MLDTKLQRFKIALKRLRADTHYTARGAKLSADGETVTLSLGQFERLCYAPTRTKGGNSGGWE